jgi:hypothetical protein
MERRFKFTYSMLRKTSIPGFWSPMLFMIPQGVSQILIPRFPAFGFKVNPFVQMPPTPSVAPGGQHSVSMGHTPEATRKGVANSIPPMRTAIFL